ncbi:hypothetical protein IC229_33145 [Spirosoma sp. BT702]|uniref:Uncharacterized protein n=1 Tax=Spirosoma profusum TaxID=2771354 RepID=A0A927GAY4_9BACT|nr:hypothetical protein [Spirosoma profusum]MBD2705505.1 hypothetical protein [Spirosoma profusum]
MEFVTWIPTQHRPKRRNVKDELLSLLHFANKFAASGQEEAVFLLTLHHKKRQERLLGGNYKFWYSVLKRYYEIKVKE